MEGIRPLLPLPGTVKHGTANPGTLILKAELSHRVHASRKADKNLTSQAENLCVYIRTALRSAKNVG
jgi:hypothetical protein